MGIIVFSELIEPSYGAEIFVEFENDFVSDKFKVEISSVDIVHYRNTKSMTLFWCCFLFANIFHIIS